MRFNFKENMHGHFNHMRSYVLNDESALLMATYPRGNRPARPFPYYNEVMTGFEYTAAVGMLYEGDIENGLKCIAAVRDRYDGHEAQPLRRSRMRESLCAGDGELGGDPGADWFPVFRCRGQDRLRRAGKRVQALLVDGLCLGYMCA